jgi:uridine kinase
LNVRVTFPGGQAREYPAGTPAATVAADPSFPRGTLPLVAVRVNNEVVHLRFELTVNCTVAPVELDDKQGLVIYRRSLSLLLFMAALRTFPKRRLIVGHSLGQGYFYHFDGMDSVPRDDLLRVEAEMRGIVARDMPIHSLSLSYQEAIAYFQKHNQPDTLLLLQNRNDPTIAVHSCDGVLDLAHGPLVPSTGLLSVFGLLDYPPGFILRYPPSDNPLHLGEFVENPVLFSIYREYKNWGKVLRVGCVGRLDEMIREGGIQDFVQTAEALQDKKIAEIADRINALRDQVKVVLIAGPSSSGKTTFSKKLMIQLRVVGRNPVTISLDDYYKPHSMTPLDDEGTPDFESLDALDVELLNDTLVRLLKGDGVETPVFDFHAGARKPQGRTMQLPERAILILEGIHGLNEALTPLVPRQSKHKVYVSALTQLNLDDHNRIATTDNRLIRRIVRDSQFRGHSALKTLSMWPSVRRGEDRNIFPFQNGADSAFNSALDYELAVLKVYADPLLASVKPDVAEYQEARTLLSFLSNFAPVHPRWVPATSILREFIGESAFKY